MAERVRLEELQSVIDKAIAQVMSNRAVGHGPIVCGFVAPESIAAAEAEQIAAEVARSVPNSRPTVLGIGEARAERAPRAATLPSVPIIIGLILETLHVRT
jgi:hypothetical protein